MTALHPATSKTVDLAGPTHYLDLGGPDDGPLIVAVHGLGGSAWNWLAVAPLLTTRCRMLAIDLAGHGLTPAAGRSTSVQANRALLDRFLREVVAEPVVLMGNSMGGLITLLETAKSPDLVLGAVLVDPALPRPLLSRVDPRVALQFAVVAMPGFGEAAFARRRKRQTIPEQVRETLKLCTVDISRIPPEVIAEGIRSIESRTPGEFSPTDTLKAGRSLLRLLGRPQLVRRRFQQITAPVLLLHGDRDRLVSIKVATASFREFPQWRFEIAEDIGHVPMLEAPEWTAGHVIDWLTHDAKLLSA
ncbi:MAG TPA: alpha/beta hydrolase [Mycobacteriales bacterium]|nr:alpha/beta hydrolase [Mycobacteriales bacterium]